MDSMIRETRPFTTSNRIDRVGKTTIECLCPFCAQTTTAYLWSISGTGKLCECGAKFASHGQAYKLVPILQEGRGSGNTKRQMLASPERSVFVWVNGAVDYPKRLARSLGRDDLEIVSPEWINSDSWRGRDFPAIILDHAARLHNREYDMLRLIRSTRVRANG